MRRAPAESGRANFADLFRKRRDQFSALLGYSRRQSDLIQADDYTELLVVLGQKQGILSRIDEINKQFPGLQDQWRQWRDHLDADTRDTCDRLLDETERILAELIEHEQASTVRLTERRNATQRQLEAVSEGSRVHQAYRDAVPPATHRHLDVDQ